MQLTSGSCRLDVHIYINLLVMHVGGTAKQLGVMVSHIMWLTAQAHLLPPYARTLRLLIPRRRFPLQIIPLFLQMHQPR